MCSHASAIFSFWMANYAGSTCPILQLFVEYMLLASFIRVVPMRVLLLRMKSLLLLRIIRELLSYKFIACKLTSMDLNLVLC